MPGVVSARSAKPYRIPLHRTLPRFIRDPYTVLEEVGRQANGAVAQLDLGLFRPYLLSHPDHVQHVLRDNAKNYVRGGRFWRPLHHLFGDGILAEDGASWEWSRRTLQPLFTKKYIESLLDQLCESVTTAVDELARRASAEQPLNAGEEMSRIVSRTAVKVLFADQISAQDVERVVAAVGTIGTSVVLRMFLGVSSPSVPVPGDRAYRRAVRTVDEVMMPLVRRARHESGDGGDIISALGRARDRDGHELTERQIRDDIVALFVTANETTSVMLTWLWPVLQAYPDIASRVYDEIDGVVGGQPVGRSHVARLHYTQAVLDELLRMYPAAWIFPRRVVRPDRIGGVQIKGGATVFVSPFVTHRMAAFWERPDVFAPERFLASRNRQLHRYAYFPFGGGPHQCIGKHFFQLKALLIVASVLSRFRPVPVGDGTPPRPAVAASLRPGGRIEINLFSVERRLAA
ncbi:cytochrome P450 [Actinomycetes bacterium KLBMP 9797]